MKSKFLSVLCCSVALLAPGVVLAADPAPAVPIERVVQIAKQSLAERKVDGVYIESITLERGTMFSSSRRWYVKWSAPLQGSAPEIHELGLAIKMDGTVIHVVKEQVSAKH